MNIGIDMTSIKRVNELSDSARRKLLTNSERKLPTESQAGAIASKEALSKALGEIPPPWSEIEVAHKKSGEPYFILSRKLRTRARKVALSITHEKGFAIAVVLVDN